MSDSESCDKAPESPQSIVSSLENGSDPENIKGAPSPDATERATAANHPVSSTSAFFASALTSNQHDARTVFLPARMTLIAVSSNFSGIVSTPRRFYTSW